MASPDKTPLGFPAYCYDGARPPTLTRQEQARLNGVWIDTLLRQQANVASPDKTPLGSK